jgi:hypothetical protein
MYLKAHCCAGNDVQVHAIRFLTVKDEIWVGLNEMEVTANLQRTQISVFFQEGY